MGSDRSVANYYDSNTRRFLTVGGGGRTLSIHRHLWGPGVRTTEEAAGYVNRLVADRVVEICATPSPTVLDMGCGVGGTLFHLGRTLPESRLHGITISDTQCRMARRLADERGLGARCDFHLGDFESASLDVSADVIIAVESLVHGSSPESVLCWAAAHLQPGGHVIVVDDFIADGARDGAADGAPDVDRVAGQRRVLTDFRTGWRAPAVCTVDRMRAAAEAAGLGLISDDDLTPLIRLGRPRDRAIALVSPVLRATGLGRFPFVGNMVGGNALQTGLRTGLFEYRMLVLRNGP